MQKGRVLVHRPRPQDKVLSSGIIVAATVAENFRPEWQGWQNTGTAVSVGPGSEIPVGTQVRFHHNAVANGTEWSNDYFVIEEKFVYYYMDGEKPKSVGVHVLAEPILDPPEEMVQNGIILATKAKAQYRVAKVRSLPPVIPDDYWEVNEGETVIWSMKTPIKIEVGDDMWYVLRWEHIMGLGEPVSDEEMIDRKRRDAQHQKEVEQVVLEINTREKLTQKHMGRRLREAKDKKRDYFY